MERSPKSLWKTIGQPCLVLAAGFGALLAPDLGPALEEATAPGPLCGCARPELEARGPQLRSHGEVGLLGGNVEEYLSQPACGEPDLPASVPSFGDLKPA